MGLMASKTSPTPPFFTLSCLIFLGGNSQSSLKMRIKLGKQSVEKAKVDLGGVVS